MGLRRKTMRPIWFLTLEVVPLMFRVYQLLCYISFRNFMLLVSYRCNCWKISPTAHLYGRSVIGGRVHQIFLASHFASPLRMFISTCWNKKNEQSFCLYSLFSDPLAVTNYSYAFYTIIFNREWIGKNRTFRIKTQKTDFWKSNTHWYFIEENDRLAFVRRHTCLINFNTILQTWPLSEWC